MACLQRDRMRCTFARRERQEAGIRFGSQCSWNVGGQCDGLVGGVVQGGCSAAKRIQTIVSSTFADSSGWRNGGNDFHFDRIRCIQFVGDRELTVYFSSSLHIRGIGDGTGDGCFFLAVTVGNGVVRYCQPISCRLSYRHTFRRNNGQREAVTCSAYQ